MATSRFSSEAVILHRIYSWSASSIYTCQPQADFFTTCQFVIKCFPAPTAKALPLSAPIPLFVHTTRTTEDFIFPIGAASAVLKQADKSNRSRKTIQRHFSVVVYLHRFLPLSIAVYNLSILLSILPRRKRERPFYQPGQAKSGR